MVLAWMLVMAMAATPHNGVATTGGVQSPHAPTPAKGGRAAMDARLPSLSKLHGDARAVMETELAFEKQSEARGADAWYEFAAKDVSDPGFGAHDRDELKASVAKAYAQPGFRLRWKP